VVRPLALSIAEFIPRVACFGIAQIWLTSWSVMLFYCDVLGSSQGDLGWALAGEATRGDGEAGERFSLAVLNLKSGICLVATVLILCISRRQFY
jgi:hypothetical protein